MEATAPQQRLEGEAKAATRRKNRSGGGPGSWATMTVAQGVLIVYALIVVIPVVSSLKTNHQFLFQLFAIPTTLHFEHYPNAWS